MKIAVISGSHRMGRQSHRIAEYMVALANTKGHEGIMLDIVAYDFPVMDERLGYLEVPHPGLEDFSNKVKTADAVIIVTPEYNGGMAGSLKNTLDYFRKEFEGKPMAAVTVSNGDFGGVNALHQLWWWMTYVGGFVAPNRLMVSQVDNVWNEAGEVVDARFMRNAEKQFDQLVWLAERLQS